MTTSVATALERPAAGLDAPDPLLHIFESLALHQALSAVAELGVADVLSAGPRTTTELASRLEVHEDRLYRVLRLLAGRGIFRETAPRVVANTPLSERLRSDVEGSLRSMARYRGSRYFYQPLGEILHTLRTGGPARSKVLGMSGWEYLRQNPEAGRLFDDAMTGAAALAAPTVASAYGFSQWGTLTELGGGNGVLLAAILRAHPTLSAVLADLPHVLDRARERGFLGGELSARCRFEACNFFDRVPPGSRAYLLKSVMHNWDDEDARRILANCRTAVPPDGALLLVDRHLGDTSTSSRGAVSDVTMMITTGGRERTDREYRALLDSAGFRLNRVVSAGADFDVMEALPG